MGDEFHKTIDEAVQDLRDYRVFPLDDHFTVQVTTPIKRAVRKYASVVGMSSSDIIRIAIIKLIEQTPEFTKIYNLYARANELDTQISFLDSVIEDLAGVVTITDQPECLPGE